MRAFSGYEIEFDSYPIQQHILNEIPFAEDQKEIVDAEIKQLLSKGAIVPSVNEPGQFVSIIFIVPKAKGKFRPVINLKYMYSNYFVTYEHFKQETFAVV